MSGAPTPAPGTPPRAEPPQSPPEDASLLAAAPGLARIAAAAGWRTAEWTLHTATRTSARVVRAAMSGEPPAELFATGRAEVREQLRRLLGIVDEAMGGATEPAGQGPPAPRGEGPSPSRLRARGEELLRRSADVRFQEDAHPAYARILDELSPDEGRILRFLALEGPQPAVDVRTSRPLNVGSELVAPGLSMIGAHAGARNLQRVPAHLNNLYRLGLIWFSREPVEDPLRYQVLEAQPDVIEALRAAGRGKTVRRSIHLTPFGEDFCETCLPLHTAELDALPGGHPPPAEPEPGPPAGGSGGAR